MSTTTPRTNEYRRFVELRKRGGETPLRRTCLALATSLAASVLTPAASAGTVQTLPILWEAGGQSAGNDSAGQAARVVTDAFGNVAVVSGPSTATRLAVTSYTASGSFRWQSEISPASGTFQGDWVAAAPNGDFVAVGHTLTSSGIPIAIALVRFGSDGAFQWRVDLDGTLPSVGRLLVDSGGNAYLAFNSIGDGQDIVLHKYNPTGDLLWSQVINTGLFSNNYATSLALSPDESQVAIVGDTSGGSEWITALYDTTTGSRGWLVVAPEGTAALDVVMDDQRVYVTGRGKVGIDGFLTVVAYDRADGTRLWRTDKRPATSAGATGLRLAMAPDGSLVATGQASLGFLDWYTVAFETTGAVRWEAIRDGGLNADEIPAAVLVLPDGTSVVTGRGGPSLPGGFWQGVTAGYSPDGTLLWEAFSPLVTTWVTALPNGDVVATGGYDAYLAAFRPPGAGQDSFCIGDGTDGACPCGNVGVPGHGCDLAQGTGGVRLDVLAQQGGTPNSATLSGTGYPSPGSPAVIVIRAGELDPAMPVAFGDGLRCVGVPLVRLAAGFATAGASTHVIGHGAGAGAGTFYYQLWFRNTPALFCTPDGFNLSNGTALSW